MKSYLARQSGAEKPRLAIASINFICLRAGLSHVDFHAFYLVFLGRCSVAKTGAHHDVCTVFGGLTCVVWNICLVLMCKKAVCILPGDRVSLCGHSGLSGLILRQVMCAGEARAISCCWRPCMLLG